MKKLVEFSLVEILALSLSLKVILLDSAVVTPLEVKECGVFLIS